VPLSQAACGRDCPADSYRQFERVEGLCDRRTRRISVAERLAANGRVAVLVHEVAHAVVGHEAGLAKQLEELVVEAVAYVVCAGAGLDTGSDSVPYIAGRAGDGALEQLERTAELIDGLARRTEQERNDPSHAHHRSRSRGDPLRTARMDARGGSERDACERLVLDLQSLAGASLISGSDGSTASIVGRGGQIREPELAQVHEDLPASARGRARATFRTTVPVYFHVITDGATGSLTSRQIDDQMRVLNQTFAGWEGGASTAFAFRLAGSTRTDNAAWFELDHGVAERAHRVPVRAERRGAHQKRPLSSRRR
jgi:hypothetical protein